MKKVKTLFLVLILGIAICFSFGFTGSTGCNDAETIQHNISVSSDKFETYRTVTVVNLRSDKILLEVEGYISIQNSAANELAVIIKTAENEYKMHYIYLAQEVVYLVEQSENTTTDPYHWAIRIHAILPSLV